MDHLLDAMLLIVWFIFLLEFWECWGWNPKDFSNILGKYRTTDSHLRSQLCWVFFLH
jgi:hypothetical protein